MKKMYFAPEMEELELEMLTMLATSDTDVTEEDYENLGGNGESGAIAE